MSLIASCLSGNSGAFGAITEDLSKHISNFLDKFLSVDQAFLKQNNLDKASTIFKSILNDYIFKRAAEGSFIQHQFENQNPKQKRQSCELIGLSDSLVSDLENVSVEIEFFGRHLDQAEGHRAVEAQHRAAIKAVTSTPILLKIFEVKLFLEKFQIDEIISEILSDLSLDFFLALLETEAHFYEIGQVIDILTFFEKNWAVLVDLDQDERANKTEMEDFSSRMNRIWSQFAKSISKAIVERKENAITNCLKAAILLNSLHFQSPDFFRAVNSYCLKKAVNLDEEVIKMQLQLALECDFDFGSKMETIDRLFLKVFSNLGFFSFGDCIFFLNLYVKYEPQLDPQSSRAFPAQFLRYCTVDLFESYQNQLKCETLVVKARLLLRSPPPVRHFFTLDNFDLKLVNNFIIILGSARKTDSPEMAEFLELMLHLVFLRSKTLPVEDFLDFLFLTLKFAAPKALSSDQKKRCSKAFLKVAFLLQNQHLQKLLLVNNLMIRNPVLARKCNESIISRLNGVDKVFNNSTTKEYIEYIRELLSLMVKALEVSRLLKQLDDDMESMFFRFLNDNLFGVKLKDLNSALRHFNPVLFDLEFVGKTVRFFLNQVQSASESEEVGFEESLKFLEWVKQFHSALSTPGDAASLLIFRF